MVGKPEVRAEQRSLERPSNIGSRRSGEDRFPFHRSWQVILSLTVWFWTRWQVTRGT